MIPMIRRPRLSIFLALLALALAACGGDGGGQPSENGPSMGVRVLGAKPNMTRSEYMALPDSARLDAPGEDGSSGMGRGVAVEVAITLNGFQGKDLPLAYSLHDARNDLPFVSNTIPVAPDAPRWQKQAHVWLPVPSAGSYYVQVQLNDSTGRKTDGPRTTNFTIE